MVSDCKAAGARPSRGRRQLVRGAGAAAMGFFGPWTLHRAWAQAKGKKPLVIGLTTDDTGQYAASGQDEQRGIAMAIQETNERGGVLGRRLETVHADTGGDAAKASAVAQRMLAESEVAFMLGGAGMHAAQHEGDLALGQHALRHGRGLGRIAAGVGMHGFQAPPARSRRSRRRRAASTSTPTPAHPPKPARTATAPSSSGTETARIFRPRWSRAP
jgi:hypothetical protein